MAHLVLGLGDSGYWATRLVMECLKGSVVVVDDATRPYGVVRELRERAESLGLSFQAFLGGCPSLPPEVSTVVVSPGVHAGHPLIRQALDNGIEVVGEMELAWRQINSPAPFVMAVTGTNGKTTVASMIGHIFSTLGEDVWVGGNIGTPLSRLIVGGAVPPWLVLEVSSFQLEWVETFNPSLGVLLNLGEDHLDRHGTMDVYRALKARIFPRQGKSLLNAEDPWLSPLKSDGMYFFSFSGPVERGLGLRRGTLWWVDGSGRERVSGLQEIGHPLFLHIDNVVAAVAAGRLAGLAFPSILTALKSFTFPPHRLELVAVKGGIRFYDDSKATNPSAVRRALSLVKGPLILLMGGHNKGLSFSSLRSTINQRAKGLVVFGEAKGEILSHLSGLTVPVAEAVDMEEAFRKALVWAGPGDAVLLSPGCASFDEFSSYAERGEAFSRLVSSLDFL